jgi:hypothetical protein
LAAESAVSSVDVVVDPPQLCHHLSLEEAVEELAVQVFIPEPTVEALDPGVLPRQRGTNENFNGLVRRFVGKGTNLSAHSQQDLDRISLRINTMSRRLHRWDSAKDRYDAAVVAPTA